MSKYSVLVLPGGEITKAYDADGQYLGRTLASYGGNSTVVINAAHQIRLGQDITAGASIQLIGGDDPLESDPADGSTNHSGKGMVLYGSTRLETWAENSHIELDAPGRLDILAQEYAYESNAAGFIVSATGQLPSDATIDLWLDKLGYQIEGSVTIIATDTADNTKIDDLLADLNSAFAAASYQVSQSDDPSSLAVGTPYNDFSATPDLHVGVRNGRLWFASNYEFALRQSSIDVAQLGLSGLASGDLTSSQPYTISAPQNGSAVSIGSASRDNGKLYIAGPIVAHSVINLYSGTSADGRDLDLTSSGLLETRAGSIEFKAGTNWVLEGSLTAGGTGSDVVLSGAETLQVRGNIKAADEIRLSAGTTEIPEQVSIETFGTSHLATTEAGGRIVISGMNDVVINSTVGPGSVELASLEINSEKGNLEITQESGRLESSGRIQLGGKSISLFGTITSTATTDSADGFEFASATPYERDEAAFTPDFDAYEVNIGASDTVTITGTLDLAGSLLVAAGNKVSIYDTTLEVTGTGNRLHVVSDKNISLGRTATASGHASYPDGQRYQQGGLVRADSRLHLQAVDLVQVGSAVQLMTSGQDSQIVIESGNLEVVGSIYAGATLAIDGETIEWTATGAAVDINATELVALGGLGVDNATGQQVTRGGSIQATGGVDISVTGGTSETALNVNALSSIRTDATGGGSLSGGSNSQISLASDRSVQIYGVIRSLDAGSDISVGSTAALLLIDGYLHAADHLQLSGGSDSYGNGVNVTALLYQTDAAGNYLDENGKLLDADGYLVNANGDHVDSQGNVVDSSSKVLGGELVRLSGGTLHTDAGGTVSVTAAGNVILQGVAGSLRTDDTDTVVTVLTDVAHVSLASTASDLTITGLVNANQSAELSGANISVLSEAAVKVRNPEDLSDAVLKIATAGAFFVDESLLTLDRALIESAGEIQVTAGSVLIEGVLRTTKAGERLLINSAGNVWVTGEVKSAGDLDVRAGVASNWTDEQRTATNVSASDLSGGLIELSGEGSLDAAGSLNILAGQDVSISAQSSLTGDTRTVPDPVITQQATTISVVTGSRQVAIGFINVPVVSWEPTLVTREVGTESVLAGSYVNKMEVTFEPAGFYNGSTQRYYFMEGDDYTNEQVFGPNETETNSAAMFHELTTDEQIDAVLGYLGYKRLYQFTYDSNTAKRYQTFNGNFTTPDWTPKWAGNTQQIYTFDDLTGDGAAEWNKSYIRMPKGAEEDVLEVVKGESIDVKRTVGYYQDTAVALFTQDKSTLTGTVNERPEDQGSHGDVLYEDNDDSPARWTISAKNNGIGTRDYVINTPQNPIASNSAPLPFNTSNQTRSGSRTQTVNWDGDVRYL